MSARLAILGFLAVGLVPGRGQDSQTDGTRPKYLAFRTHEPMTSDRWQTLLKDAATFGIKPIETRDLQREGILVFETPEDPTLLKKIDKRFSRLTPVPVREFRGVVSVSSGCFYLQFQDQVPLDVVRKRISDAGFKIVTPDLSMGSVIAVEGSRLPADRERELAKLKKLPELLYAAPDDIPLPVRKSPGR